MRIDPYNIWDKIWRDKHGRIVVWQTPNALLIAWAVLTTISLFFNGTTSSAFSWLGNAALLIWSLLELFKGVNYFRRIMGLAVLTLAILSIIKSF